MNLKINSWMKIFLLCNNTSSLFTGSGLLLQFSKRSARVILGVPQCKRHILRASFLSIYMIFSLSFVFLYHIVLFFYGCLCEFYRWCKCIFCYIESWHKLWPRMNKTAKEWMKGWCNLPVLSSWFVLAAARPRSKTGTMNYPLEK